MDTGKTVDPRDILPPEQPPDLLEDTALPVDGLLEAFDRAYAWQQQDAEQQEQEQRDEQQDAEQQQLQELEQNKQTAQQTSVLSHLAEAGEANKTEPRACQAAPDDRTPPTLGRQHGADEHGNMHSVLMPTGPAAPQQLVEQSPHQQVRAVAAELQSAPVTQQSLGVGKAAVAADRQQSRWIRMLHEAVAELQLADHSNSDTERCAAETGQGLMPGCPAGTAQCQLCGRSAVD